MATILFPMPYAALSSTTLSLASRRALEEALKTREKLFSFEKMGVVFILAEFEGTGLEGEIALKRELLARGLGAEGELTKIIEVRARDEENLFANVEWEKFLFPKGTLFVFAERTHALMLRRLLKGHPAARLKTFRAEFEANHPWIWTSSAPAWFLRNAALRLWFSLKKSTRRKIKRRLHRLFRI